MLLRRLHPFRLQLRCSFSKSELTPEQKERLRSALPAFSVEQDIQKEDAWSGSVDIIDDDRKVFDEIRARGFLKVKVAYVPAKNCSEVVNGLAEKYSLQPDSAIPNLKVKNEILTELGSKYKHYVPSSQLHRMNTTADILKFYDTPKDNITSYAKIARDEEKPENLQIRETPVRFHPNDKNAYHKGVTAFPGDGGEVISLRNKRIYRQFRPKKEWFDFEEQNFDHEPVDKGCPWDPEMAAKMDTYIDRKLKGRKFYKS